MMMDTIGLNFSISVDQEALASWGYHRLSVNRGFVIFFESTVYSENGAPIHYQYFPYILKGSPLLKVEFSLPHILFGTNVETIYDVKGAIDLANEKLPRVPGVPSIDLSKGSLYRLDICYNHQVGDLVPYFIRALQFLEFPYRKTLPYCAHGVQFLNGQVALKFYDKKRECLDRDDLRGAEAASGILRQETTYHKRAVRRLLGSKHPTPWEISTDLLLDALENELDKLGLLGRSIATRKTALEQLCATYGPDAGIYYYGLLVSKMEQPSREVIATTTGLHPRSLDRKLKKIVKADVPLTLTQTEELLPPLVIDRKRVKRLVEERLVSKNTG